MVRRTQRDVPFGKEFLKKLLIPVPGCLRALPVCVILWCIWFSFDGAGRRSFLLYPLGATLLIGVPVLASCIIILVTRKRRRGPAPEEGSGIQESFSQRPADLPSLYLSPFEFWSAVAAMWLGGIGWIGSQIWRSLAYHRWIAAGVWVLALPLVIIGLIYATKALLRRRRRVQFLSDEKARRDAMLPDADWSGAVLSEKARQAQSDEADS